jgi:hypothetical protein
MLNCFLLMLHYVCYLIQNTISIFRWSKIQLKKYIKTSCKSPLSRISMHVLMEWTLGWSMPLEHSGIIHDTIAKKWPNLRMSNSNDDSWCSCILCCAHSYIRSMTILWPRNMILDSHNIMFCMFQFAYILFMNINSILGKLKLGFTWIV